MRVAGQRKIEELTNRQYYYYKHESYCNTFQDCLGYFLGIILLSAICLHLIHDTVMT